MLKTLIWSCNSFLQNPPGVSPLLSTLASQLLLRNARSTPSSTHHRLFSLSGIVFPLEICMSFIFVSFRSFLSHYLLSNFFHEHLIWNCNLFIGVYWSPLCHLTCCTPCFIILIMGHLPRMWAPWGQEFLSICSVLRFKRVPGLLPVLNKYFLNREMKPRLPFCLTDYAWYLSNMQKQLPGV